MLREEAIRELKILKENCWDDDGYGHETKQYDDTILALDMAIKALEQESCEDAVSRNDIYFKLTNGAYLNETTEQFIDRLIKELKAMPSVTPTKCIATVKFSKEDMQELIDEKMKEIVVERKKGKWIFTKTIFDKHGCTVECPSCHKKWKTYDEIRWKKENRFCPNCGCFMSERGKE